MALVRAHRGASPGECPPCAVGKERTLLVLSFPPPCSPSLQNKKTETRVKAVSQLFEKHETMLLSPLFDLLGLSGLKLLPQGPEPQDFSAAIKRGRGR